MKRTVILLLLCLVLVMILSTRKSPFKSKYKAIILVYASHNEEIYRNGRENWLRFKDSNPNFKVLFIYAGDPDKEYGLEKQDCDLIYEDLSDRNAKNLLGNTEKTHRGIKYASENYEYDYIVRTSITCVLDLNALDKYLDTLQKDNLYHGERGVEDTTNTPFVVGQFIVLSRDVADKLVNTTSENEMHIEDVNLGKTITGDLEVPITPMDANKYLENCELYTDLNKNSMASDIDRCISRGVIVYRIKNLNGNRLQLDSLYSSQLIDKLYPK